jgi:membrane protein implicated in regulation of membrane protease activity
MAGKGEISRLRAWLLFLASLLDDAAVLALVLLGLWLFHVKITWVLILIICMGMVAYVFIMHRAIVPSLTRRKSTGSEGMIGMSGTVTEPLKPEGTVKIKDEYWSANSVEGDIDVGEVIEVVGIVGLKLEVRRKS